MREYVITNYLFCLLNGVLYDVYNKTNRKRISYYYIEFNGKMKRVYYTRKNGEYFMMKNEAITLYPEFFI